MRKNRIMIWELLLIVMILLCGCGKRASSEAVVPADIVIHIEPETEPIVIEVEPEESETAEGPEIYEPWERMEADGMVRSYLTGELVPVAQGNRRPLAIMMSNDKAALPQYGINRAGVVY